MTVTIGYLILFRIVFVCRGKHQLLLKTLIFEILNIPKSNGDKPKLSLLSIPNDISQGFMKLEKFAITKIQRENERRTFPLRH